MHCNNNVVQTHKNVLCTLQKLSQIFTQFVLSLHILNNNNIGTQAPTKRQVERNEHVTHKCGHSQSLNSYEIHLKLNTKFI